jgi:phosphohistidine phosphatase
MSSLLYLVRHGIAEADAATGSDADRCLTAVGARKMRRAALGLQRLGVVPDAVLASPLRRAEQTAAILVEVLAPSLAVEIYPPLAPGQTAEDVLRGLGAHRGAHHVMLVGHQPDLGRLASHLLTGSATITALPFKKGGVAAIHVASLPPRAAGFLAWFMTPKQLRAVGRGMR